MVSLQCIHGLTAEDLHSMWVDIPADTIAEWFNVLPYEVL